MSGNTPWCTIPQFNTKYDCELHGGEWSGPEDAEDEIIEPNPVAPPFGFNPSTNQLYGTLSPLGQWVWTNGGWIANPDYQEQEEGDFTTTNYVHGPIIEVDLIATEDDGIYYQIDTEEKYIGSYHKHEDGTLMVGAGELGVQYTEAHFIPEEILSRKFVYADIKETREIVSDLIYKKWFEKYTLTDEEVLSAQTTIRGGKQIVGRSEDEQLVYFKKDRNALENRFEQKTGGNIKDNELESIFQYVFDNNIIDLESRFSIIESNEPPVISTTEIQEQTTQDTTAWYLEFQKNTGTPVSIHLATRVGDTFTDALNLAQITKIKTTTSKINPAKARDILDTNIFELLPSQPNRQQRINDFFTEFNELIGPKPAFEDVDGDGAGERPLDIEQDEALRISTAEDKQSAYITRTDDQTEEDSQNQGKTLESMRNKLNTYLGDVDNVIETFEDQRPEWENKSTGFLKIRKPNQAIILRAPDDGLMEFQKDDSYLTDGFTITMWVRFVSRTSEGTLFNFGNPLESDGVGFRLDTKTNQYDDKYYRYIRLMVRDNDGEFYDNHWGISGMSRFGHRSYGGNANTVEGAYGYYDNGNSISYYPQIHRAFPQISTEDLPEWYFICASYNPNVVELSYDEHPNNDPPNLRTNTQYWLNHVNEDGEIVADSGLGAKCKVEIISRTDLLNARGYKGSSLTISTLFADEGWEAPDPLEDDDSDENGDDGNGDDGNGGNPPTVGFTKDDLDWRTFESVYEGPTEEEEPDMQG